MMEFIFLIGRVLYGGLFILSGINHFRNASMMTGWVGSKGVPAPGAAVLGSGVLFLLGGLSIVLGFRPTWGVVCLTVALVPVTLIIHNYWADTDPTAQMNNFINFEKNVALLGAAWIALMVPQPWPFALG